MHIFEKDWEHDKKNNIDIAYVKVWNTDFYGPFLYLEVKRYADGNIEIIPYLNECIERPALNGKDDHAILVECSKELLETFGTFTLKLTKKRWKFVVESAEKLDADLTVRERAGKYF